MNSRRMVRPLVLLVGVVAGYFAVVGFVHTFHESNEATNVVLATDDTCSATSPEVAMCEMPGELSRADYFRLAATAAQQQPAGDATKDVPAEFGPDEYPGRDSEEIEVERKIKEKFPMGLQPGQAPAAPPK